MQQYHRQCQKNPIQTFHFSCLVIRVPIWKAILYSTFSAGSRKAGKWYNFLSSQRTEVLNILASMSASIAWHIILHCCWISTLCVTCRLFPVAKRTAEKGWIRWLGSYKSACNLWNRWSDYSIVHPLISVELVVKYSSFLAHIVYSPSKLVRRLQKIFPRRELLRRLTCDILLLCYWYKYHELPNMRSVQPVMESYQ